jgi:hypothetical protein
MIAEGINSQLHCRANHDARLISSRDGNAMKFVPLRNIFLV